MEEPASYHSHYRTEHRLRLPSRSHDIGLDLPYLLLPTLNTVFDHSRKGPQPSDEYFAMWRVRCYARKGETNSRFEALKLLCALRARS